MDNMEIKRIFDNHYSNLFENSLNPECRIKTHEVAKTAESLTVKYVQTVNNLVGNSPWDPRLCVRGNPFNWKPYVVGNSPWDPR